MNLRAERTKQPSEGIAGAKAARSSAHSFRTASGRSRTAPIARVRRSEICCNVRRGAARDHNCCHSACDARSRLPRKAYPSGSATITGCWPLRCGRKGQRQAQTTTRRGVPPCGRLSGHRPTGTTSRVAGAKRISLYPGTLFTCLLPRSWMA